MDKYCNCTSSLTGYWGPKGNHNGRSSALFGANVRGISNEPTKPTFRLPEKKESKIMKKEIIIKKETHRSISSSSPPLEITNYNYVKKTIISLANIDCCFFRKAICRNSREKEIETEKRYIYVCMEHGESFVVISKCQFYFTSFILYVCLHEEIYCRLWELIVDGIMNQRTGVCRWINQVQTHRV